MRNTYEQVFKYIKNPACIIGSKAGYGPGSCSRIIPPKRCISFLGSSLSLSNAKNQKLVKHQGCLMVPIGMDEVEQ